MGGLEREDGLVVGRLEMLEGRRVCLPHCGVSSDDGGRDTIAANEEVYRVNWKSFPEENKKTYRRRERVQQQVPTSK